MRPLASSKKGKVSDPSYCSSLIRRGFFARKDGLVRKEREKSPDVPLSFFRSFANAENRSSASFPTVAQIHRPVVNVSTHAPCIQDRIQSID